jgi:hypothetical protein
MIDWLRMDIIEISYIDTSELDGYIREAIKRWENTDVNRWGIIQIRTRHVWKDDSSTKAVYFCPYETASRYAGPIVMIYVDYDEVDMTGKIEIEHLGSFSNKAKEELVKIFNEVVGSFDPSLAPLPFGVKCPHCQARYVYSKRTGVVRCQNCDKPFELELQEKTPSGISESVEDYSKRKRLVAVDRSKVTRCKWCGTIESSNWVYTSNNEAFCSKNCYYANNMELNGIFGLCCICIVPLILMTIMMAGGPIPEFILLIFVSWLLSMMSVYSYFTGNRVRREVPKNSRRP